MDSRRSQTVSWIASCIFHGVLISLLFLSLEKTIFVPATAGNEPNKQIIDAVMINQESLQKEVARLETIEQKKREKEQLHQQELIRKEKEAKLKREKEEALLMELKQKNEKLKKEAELQKIAEQKQAEERKAKLKAEQDELKKIQKEKEAALVAKKKAEDDRKTQELAKQKQAEKDQEAAQQNNVRVKQDLITQHAMLLRNKIHQNWRQPMGMDIKGFTCKVAVKLLPTGEVVDAQVVASSGNLEFDRSTELAIRKASPLPMPSDPDVAKEFRQFTFTFHPEAA